ncbi:TetR/AcrR family transcriptional regulator [Puia sp.]|jgi:AcrR family transcriptional regulator|uniref:TetR/AcrR family transcriptional regulator n=1 Tax=Puia sp. TaxID=2045100 RepID=UPI002F3F1B5B
MGITDRKLRQKEEVRASILDAAWEMVVTDGWHSFSIRKVADAIEYSVPVIYSHFENKDAILLEFNRKGFQLLTDALIAAKAGQPLPANQIRAMGRAYWDFAFRNKEYYQLMFGLGIPTCETVSKIPAMITFNEVITSSIVAMVPAGNPLPFDPFLKYQSFWSMLHGLVSINMSTLGRTIQTDGHHDNLPLKVLEDVMCSFIRGIEAAEAPAGNSGRQQSEPAKAPTGDPEATLPSAAPEAAG